MSKKPAAADVKKAVATAKKPAAAETAKKPAADVKATKSTAAPEETIVVTKSVPAKSKPAAKKAVAPAKEPTPEPEEEPEASEDDTTLAPYPFFLSDEKGKKAAVRFRENFRKYYPQLGLAEGLTLKDKPIMELYCYDHNTHVSYCRIWSKKHDGPFFANVDDLYTHYNLSKQGHPVDVFTYAGTDEDRNMELGEFLKVGAMSGGSKGA